MHATLNATESDPPLVHGRAPNLLQRLPATLVPAASLLQYYLLTSLLFGPFFIIAAVPMYFRYRTLRYDIDEEGITMRWGILFRREVSLTYARIQDIQLSSNVVERRLGLARIQLQTASGSASAEMTIEGMHDVEAMRDFLYARMRGAADPSTATPTDRSSDADPITKVSGSTNVSAADVAELTAVLDAVAAELRALRERGSHA